MTSLPIQGSVKQGSPRTSKRILWALTALAVAAMVFLNVTLFMSFGFWQGENAAIYWLSFSPFPVLIATTIAAFMLPFAALNRLALAFRMIVSLLVAFVIFAAYVTLLGPAIGQPQHRQSLRMSGHTYHFAIQTDIFTWVPSPLAVAYLFECDALGLICHRIYASEATDTYALAISADSAAGEIQLLGIDGEVLTTVTPDP